MAREDWGVAIRVVLVKEKQATMIARIKKAISVAALIVFGIAFTGALAYSTIKSWRDTAVFNVAFWIVVGLVALYVERMKRDAKAKGKQ